MRKHRTAKGREFNMQSFADSRGDSVAVGNSGRNARGDLLGPGGRVIATNQEINNRFHDRQSKGRTAQVKINPMEQEIGRKEVVGADGVARWEITYADGSVEMQEIPNQPAPKKPKVSEQNAPAPDVNTDTSTGEVN